MIRLFIVRTARITAAILIFFSVGGCQYFRNYPNVRDLVIMTEQSPPYNFKEDGKMQGISVDLLDAVFKKMRLGLTRDNIQMTRWVEQYQRTLDERNRILFSMLRTPEREQDFEWVGPIAPARIGLFCRKDKQVRINTAEDLKKVRIGVVASDAGEQLAIRAGVEKEALVQSETAEEAVRLLGSGKVDCWAYEEATGRWFLSQKTEFPGDFEMVHVLWEGELYYAFHGRFAPSVVHQFQEALDALKREKGEDGTSEYEKILSRYLQPRYLNDGISAEQVVRLVDHTAKVLAKDAPETLREINEARHPYQDRDQPALYVFIFDPNVTLVARADRNTSMLGRNYRGKTDVAGKAFRDEIVDGALRQGTGWVDYVYTSPVQSGLYYKTTYYQRVQGSDGKTYIVGAGRFRDKK
jgi:polar amino acid transport system substrate-binding protein